MGLGYMFMVSPFCLETVCEGVIIVEEDALILFNSFSARAVIGLL